MQRHRPHVLALVTLGVLALASPVHAFVCGNAIVEVGEECDDGNIVNGDGCTSQCRIQVCGNNAVEPGEQCDDGNLINGDGCSTQCQPNTCGNAVIESGEQCDDGNQTGGDGCTDRCQTQICGNGIIDLGELCDDGNLVPGDGCSANCSAECGIQGLTGTWTAPPGTNGTFVMSLIEDAAAHVSGVVFLGSIVDATPHYIISGTRNGPAVALTLIPRNSGPVNVDFVWEPCVSLRLNGSPFATRSSTTACGDGAVDPGEACDDGNLVNGDSCTAACTSPQCGNAIPESGEQCDDGNPVNGDGCSAQCQQNVCGNGSAESGEQCDDGNVVNGDGCSALCQSNTCGNGAAEPGEQCDDGNLVNGDGCSILCQSNSCGDGIVQSGEQCDDGDLLDGDGCSALCQSNVCGDDVIQAGEQCDDGNLINGDGCTNRCQTQVCGNGAREPGEECDDGNPLPGDGCTAGCVAECGVQGLAGAWLPANAGPDSPILMLVENGAGTLSGVVLGRGINSSAIPYFTVSGSRQGTSVTLTLINRIGAPATANFAWEPCGDLSLGEALWATRFSTAACGDGSLDAGETCDDGNMINGDACTAACTAATCGNAVPESGEQCDDGNLVEGDGCSVSCEPNVCGNGTLEPGEQCDDINLVDGDGCSAQCQSNTCGNGAAEPGEQCDDGNLLNGDGCSALCQSNTCGNGGLQPGEQCDDGNLVDGDGCSALCQSNTCGDGVVQPGEQCDDGNAVNGDGCTSLCQSQVCGNGTLEPGEQCDDGNPVSGDGCTTSCVAECGVGGLTGTWHPAYGGNPNRFTLTMIEDESGNVSGVVLAGGNLASSVPYYYVSGTRDGMAADLTLTDRSSRMVSIGFTWQPCSTLILGGTPFAIRDSISACGDGIVNSGEACDDGNLVGEDACPVSCTHQFCGNGILDPGEQCDDGNAANEDGCDRNCTSPGCGNHVVNLGEQCDDGNLADDDGCDHNCGVPGCPDGNVGPGEECDDGNLVDDDGCARNCRLPRCGNGIQETAEACDDGNIEGCDTCSITCALETDADQDGILGSCDNCPGAYNPSQRDRDENEFGDSCDLPVALSTLSGMTTILFDDSASGDGLAPTPVQKIAITYSSVTSDGVTSVQTIETPPGSLLDANFKMSELGEQFHLETSAGFSGNIEVCVEYDDSRLTLDDEAVQSLLHEEDGVLVDRTSSRDIDGNVLCADVSSFSRFGIGVSLDRCTQLRASFRVNTTQIGADRLKRLSSTLVLDSGMTLDPSTTGLTVTALADGEPVFTRAIPASLWVPGKRGVVEFSDKTARKAYGISKARVSDIGNGEVQVSLRGQGLDLRGAAGDHIDFRFDFGGVTFLGSAGCKVKTASDFVQATCR